MLRIIDSHCHLNLEPLYSDKRKNKQIHKNNKGWSEYWQQAKKAGICGLIVPGTSLTSSQIAVEIARKKTNIFSTIAIHPEEIKLELIKDIKNKNDYLPEKFLKNLIELKQLALLSKKIVAVGETGLDYFHLKKNNQQNSDLIIELQKRLFIRHIQLANQLELPMVLHVRDVDNSYSDNTCAYKDIIELLKKYYHFARPLIFHCISGSLKYLNQILSLDGYVSVAGNVTYPSASEIKKIVAATPLDKIIVETDAPYLAPHTKRGKINQPAFIKETVLFLQNNFRIDPENLFNNTQQAFQIKIV